MKSMIAGLATLALCASLPVGARAQDQTPSNTQAGSQSTAPADTRKPTGPITVTETVIVVGGVTAPSPIDTLSAVTAMSQDSIETMQTSSPSELFRAMPGMAAAFLGDDAGTVINIRGMQDNGRVQVVVDGARQDFSRPSHAGYGTFYLDPDLLTAVTVTRGPSAGAGGGIGGVVSFETIAPQNLLRGGRFAFRQKVGFETNGSQPTSSTTAAFQVGQKFALLGNFVGRRNNDYTDGANTRILYTANSPKSTLLKGVLAPALHHMVTVAYTGYRSDFLASRQAGNASPTLSVDQTEAHNDTVTGRWAYANPSDRFLNVVVNAYNTRTVEDQLKVKGTAPTIGQTRGYDMKTSGFNANNVSRARAFGLTHTITVGGDYLHDNGTTYGDTTAGAGSRNSGGFFTEWNGTVSRLQLLASARHDRYAIHGSNQAGSPATNSASGTSPRFTAGVTAVPGVTVYGTYVEGFRAPAIYEIFGIYASSPTGRMGLDLLPEEASGFEGGINFKRDDLLSSGARLRVKFNVYNTKVDNFITGRSVAGVFQFNNIAAARLKGYEVDANYSDGWGYVSLDGSIGSARREGGQFNALELSNAPLNRVTATIGLNSFKNRLHYGYMLAYVDDKARTTSSAPTAPLSPDYTLGYVFASYKVTNWLDARFNIDNLSNKAYNDPEAQYATTGPTSFQGRGRTVKFALSTRFGG